MAENPNPSSPLPDVFSPATRDWFLRAFKQPTAVQSRTTAALYANRSE
ncbi:TPA: endonuclease [Escherichia coli]|nr:endonuclease [Escherichia coli]